MAAIGAAAPVGSLFSPIHRYVDLDWHHLHQNIDGVREFFWAVRPLEFVPLAGLLAIGRRSWPKAVLVFGWFVDLPPDQGHRRRRRTSRTRASSGC